MTVTRPHTVAAQDRAVRASLTNLAAAAREAGTGSELVEVTIAGRTSLVPAEVAAFLGEIFGALAAGHGVLVSSLDDSVTTGKAARMLGISRTYLCTLVDENVIPCHYVGTHRRLKTRDVLDYAETRQSRRRDALDELSRLSAEAGLYNDDDI